MTMHVRMADESVCIGRPLARILSVDSVVSYAACEHGARGIHPDNGFLSKRGLVQIVEARPDFIGPTAHTSASWAKDHRKDTRKSLAPCVLGPGHGGVPKLRRRQRIARNSLS